MLGFFLLGVSAGLLVTGAELFAENASAAGRRLGISGFAVGLLLAGAEPEELVTAVIAALRDRPGIAAGDAVGANVTMLTLVLGLAALARPVPMHRGVRPYAAGAALLGALAGVIVRDGTVGRAEGAVLVLAYAGFVALVWLRERRPPAIGEVPETLEHNVSEGAGRGLLLVLVGIAVMAAGGRLAVAGAERIAETLDVADSAVGLTFVALATTAELLALVWAAARRQLEELAVAGVLGSVAYNATVTLGGAALARPLTTGGVGGAAVAAAAIPLALMLASVRSGQLTRAAGVMLVGGYGAYLIVAIA